jgi:[ribosomal protein S5]-alanine N-acetyltransferase
VKLVLSRCTVRNWHTSDAESITRYANNRNVWINVRDAFPFPYKLKDAKDFLRAALSVNPNTSFAIERNGEAIGSIGVIRKTDVYSRSAEIGYWIGEPFWGRGIATEALCAMTYWAVREFNLIRVFAGVFAWNQASARVLEKAGYQLEGAQRSHVTKDGKITDELIYARIFR